MHEAVHRGEIPPEVALDRLARIQATSTLDTELGASGGRDRAHGDDRGARPIAANPREVVMAAEGGRTSRG
jgi:hypothetical protein